MENSYKKGNVAIIEKCTMSREGLRHLFSESSINQYSFHFFKEHSVFHQALKHTLFFPSSIHFLGTGKSGGSA